MSTVDQTTPPPTEDERMAAARARALWELGDPSWAGIIVGAYLHPREDAAALARAVEA